MTTANAPQLFAATKPSRNWRSVINPTYLPLVATLLVLAVLFVIGGVQYDRFLTVKTFADLLGDNSFIGVAAIGATIVILSGGIDLSIGAVVAFTGIFMATMIGEHGWHPLTAALVAVAIGLAFGAIQGVLIALYELPPFMVTLSGMFFARAMSFVVSGVSKGIDHPFYSDTLSKVVIKLAETPGKILRSGKQLPPVPVNLQLTAIIMLVLFVLALVMLHFTGFGRNVYAVGGDEQSAKLLGVRVPRTKIFIYALG